MYVKECSDKCFLEFYFTTDKKNMNRDLSLIMHFNIICIISLLEKIT